MEQKPKFAVKIREVNHFSIAINKMFVLQIVFFFRVPL